MKCKNHTSYIHIYFSSGGWSDTYLMGLVNQVAQAFDDSVTQEVTNHLFQEPGKRFGLDLAALNIQRGREHGIPSYNRWREWCGFPAIKTWFVNIYYLY